MTHIEWIESSKTWTCPKSGKYKVICVGGGASGGGKFSSSGTYVSTVAGGTTSFGTILSAAGGASDSSNAALSNTSKVSGYGGFTGVSYGGSPSIIYNGDTLSVAFGAGNTGLPGATAGIGYGAGGGASSAVDIVIPGRAGSIKTTIVDIEAGETITCTIGAGGVGGPGTGQTATGAKGVIVVQYLGA